MYDRAGNQFGFETNWNINWLIKFGFQWICYGSSEVRRLGVLLHILPKNYWTQCQPGNYTLKLQEVRTCPHQLGALQTHTRLLVYRSVSKHAMSVQQCIYVWNTPSHTLLSLAIYSADLSMSNGANQMASISVLCRTGKLISSMPVICLHVLHNRCD